MHCNALRLVGLTCQPQQCRGFDPLDHVQQTLALEVNLGTCEALDVRLKVRPALDQIGSGQIKLHEPRTCQPADSRELDNQHTSDCRSLATHLF